MIGTAMAQSPESFLSLKQRDKQQQIQNYTGEPIVFFGPTVGTKVSQKPEFVPIQPSWRPEIPQVQISLPFGESMSVPNILHIPYFFISVQVLTDGTALVREDIQLIVPEGEAVESFTRQYETIGKDKLGRTHSFDRLFVEARHNGQSVPFLLSRNDERKEEIITFHESTPMTPGVHTYQISYQLSEAVFFDISQNQIFLSLIGRSLPYLTERLVIWLNLPKLTPIAGARVFFGVNNQTAQNVGSFLKDDEGNVVFKLKGILPAQTDVRMEVWTEKGTFEKPTVWDRLFSWIFRWFKYWIACVGAIVIWLYYHLQIHFSRTDVLDKKYQNKMSLRLSYQPVLMRFSLYKKVDASSFLSLVIGIANKGYLKIQYKKKEVVFLKSQGKGHLNRLEKAWLRYVFSNRKQVVVLNLLSVKKILHQILQPLLMKEEQHQLFVLTGSYRYVGWFLWGICGMALYFVEASFTQIVAILFFLAMIILWEQYKLIHKGAFKSFLRQAYERYETYWRQPVPENMTVARLEAFLLRRLPYKIALGLSTFPEENTLKPIWLNSEEKSFNLTLFLKEFLNKIVSLS